MARRPRGRCAATGHGARAGRAARGRHPNGKPARFRSRCPGLHDYSFQPPQACRAAPLPRSGAALSPTTSDTPGSLSCNRSAELGSARGSMFAFFLSVWLCHGQRSLAVIVDRRCVLPVRADPAPGGSYRHHPPEGDCAGRVRLEPAARMLQAACAVIAVVAQARDRRAGPRAWPQRPFDAARRPRHHHDTCRDMCRYGGGCEPGAPRCGRLLLTLPGRPWPDRPPCFVPFSETSPGEQEPPAAPRGSTTAPPRSPSAPRQSRSALASARGSASGLHLVAGRRRRPLRFSLLAAARGPWEYPCARVTFAAVATSRSGRCCRRPARSPPPAIPR